MIKYRIVFTARAERDLAGLPSEVKQRIGDRLVEMSINPFLFATRLSDPEIGTYRFRIGDYRVIFDVEGDTLIILRTGHRREIYRR